MSSAKQNAFLNATYQVLRLIFPLVTYPYVSRIIGPAGIGKVAFAHRIAEYFGLTALLGIPMYGLREVSKVRHNPDGLSQVYSELLILSSITSLAAGVVYGLLPIFLPRLSSEPQLHWVFFFLIIAAPGRLSWFYQGLEKYKYVTVRSLLVRLSTAILTFVVIRNSQDYVNYGILWVAGSVVPALLNISYSMRLTRLTFKNLRILGHLKGVLPTVGIQIVGTFASVVDIAMLGSLIQDDRYSVGLYAMASRLMRIALSLVVAGISVIMPRISASHSEGNERKTESLIRKSFSYSLFFSLPMAIGLMITARDLIFLFAGTAFIPAVLTLRILSSQLIVFALGNVVNMQVFYARGREKSVFFLSIATAIVSVLLNLALIPRYQHEGAAFATLATTVLGLIVQSSLAWPLIRRLLFTQNNGRTLLLVFIWSLTLLFIQSLFTDSGTVLRLSVVVVLGLLLYGIGALVFGLNPGRELFDWITKRRGEKQ